MTRLRDQAWRLTAPPYPISFDIRTAFGDMDSFRHLNNVALARYLEEGRATLNMALFGIDSVVRPGDGDQLLVANVVIDYVNQGFYPGQVTVCVGISRVGRSSFTHASALFQDGQCVALCDSVMVHAVEGRPHPLPDDVAERLMLYRVAGAG